MTNEASRSADSTTDAESAVLVELVGENGPLWTERRIPFFKRLRQAFDALMGVKIRGVGTVADSLEQTAASVYGHINAALETKGVDNALKVAQIGKLLAETRKIEAETSEIRSRTSSRDLEITQSELRKRAIVVSDARRELQHMMEEGKLIVIERNGRKIVALVAGTPTSGDGDGDGDVRDDVA